MPRPRKEATEEKQETAAKASVKKYKLADSTRSYYDRTFSLKNDEVKELPENVSDAVLARIKAGQIVEVK